MPQLDTLRRYRGFYRPERNDGVEDTAEALERDWALDIFINTKRVKMTVRRSMYINKYLAHLQFVR